jgi:glucose/mannose transport system substrate-binding protein
MMKERALRVLLATLMLTASAQAADLTAEVMHPWTSGGEAAAAKVFADQYTAAGGTWVDVAIAGNDAQLAASISSIVGGTPPTATHFNTGKPFEELVAAGLLRDVEDIATAEGWRDVLPKDIVDAISADGKIMAVPVNLQTENWLWYSKEVFEKSGVAEVPQSWDDFFAAADKIRAAGYIPMAHGSNSFWDRFIFQKVLVSVAGPELYLRVLRDRDPAALRDPKVVEAFATLGRLRGYVDAGSPGRLWNDATNLVITNKAGFQLMGDWAKGEFAAAGMTPGVDYGCSLFPGNEVVVMSGDIFVLPKIDNADQTAAQDLLAHVLFSQETQLQFNIKKGSNPVRNDVDVSSMDVCAQHAAKVQANPATLVPNPQFLMSNDMLGAMADVITKFWNTPSMTPDAFTTELEAAFASAV